MISYKISRWWFTSKWELNESKLVCAKQQSSFTLTCGLDWKRSATGGCKEEQMLLCLRELGSSQQQFCLSARVRVRVRERADESNWLDHWLSLVESLSLHLSRHQLEASKLIVWSTLGAEAQAEAQQLSLNHRPQTQPQPHQTKLSSDNLSRTQWASQ